MNALWLVARYLVDRAHCRARAALRGHPEAGALSLEWIIIATLVVAAAVAVGGLITVSINKESAKLP
jgi:flagellar basal body-associated protein FliL